MIYEIIQIITEQVNNYLDQNGLEKSVVAGNIAWAEVQKNTSAALEDKTVLTLIRIEEDKALKNIPNYVAESSKTLYKSNDQSIILYLIFSANRNAYVNSLNEISKINTFFQEKSLFTQANTLYSNANDVMKNIKSFRFTVTVYTPEFEELNHIWGTLGGRQLPSLLYKVSHVEMEFNSTQV
ncbi:DUF4255 domain-containing protein [Flavobacterium sp. ACN6]|uniref:DUF4255 domain-containing protein n=1 Tax=Flavobacterium sp. ACN6 TaxID=1920426 RepID=UPI000BB32363|nr:DUF4255 domain-containing protein [Flavobacterium sp. ACN6]PBJ15891.1 hypothetical protein BSF42_02950 [Flavobacterium sp. ACN6]